MGNDPGCFVLLCFVEKWKIPIFQFTIKEFFGKKDPEGNEERRRSNKGG